MKYYEWGKQHEITILLLPGTCCNVKCNFSQVIPLLAEHYHVIGVDYDGFDGQGAEFTDMLTVTRKIESFISIKLNSKANIVYGSSLGGSFVGLLVQRNRIHIDHAIIGSSDLDQSGKLSAWLQTQLVGGAFYGMFKKGQMPQWMRKLSEKKMGKETAHKFAEMLSCISEAMQTASKRSMKRQFYSDLVTPLGEKIKADGTTVHIFYALQMGEKYRERYLLHFAEPDIIEQDYGHEELLFFYPEEWVEEIRKCCDKKRKCYYMIYNNIGIDSNLDWKRIRKLFIIGLLGGCMTFVGDWLLGYGICDESLSGLEKKLSQYLVLSDGKLFWSAFLGLIGISLEGLCYFGIYRLIANGSMKHAHVFRSGVFGYMLFAACGVHVPCLSTVFFYKHIMLESPDTAYDLTLKFGVYFLLPAMILFLIFFFVMSAAQISAFAKGLTPYPKWCWIFSMPVGMAATMLLKFTGNHAVTNGLTAAWISIGNIWMFGGLLMAMQCAIHETTNYSR